MDVYGCGLTWSDMGKCILLNSGQLTD